MKFELPNELESGEASGKTERASPLFSSRSNQGPNLRRLFMLIGLLGFTIYAMIEAGKPERWHWLIPPEGERKKVAVIEIEASSENENSRTTDSTTQWLPESSRAISSAVSDDPNSDSSVTDSAISSGVSPDHSAASNRITSVDISDYPKAAEKYWRDTIPKMTLGDRTQLFRCLRLARIDSNPDESVLKSLDPLLKSLQQARSKFHEQLLNQATYTTLGADKKAELANELFESEQAWNREELPALTAFVSGKAPDFVQLESILRLQTVLDPIIYSLIDDRTAQGWEGDMPGWERMWEILQAEKTAPPTRVTHLELMAQPDAYRGKPISVNGWVRGAWKEKLTVKELGIESLYVLAVRPEDSKVSPYFVYLTKLPRGWPIITEQYVELNQRITVSGLFFKIRTYLDTEKKVREAPMILAADVTALAEKSLPKADTSALANPYLVVGGLIGMIALAIGVACFVFRTTETIRFKPGANRAREINEQLESLASDPEVKSNRDRIQDLYE